MKISKFDIVLLLAGIGFVYFMWFAKVDFGTDPKAGGVQFKRVPFKTALQEASSSNKPLLIDVYATWCGPCKLMKKTTFSSDDLGNFLTEKTLPLTIDGETPEGSEVANFYGVTAYPTLLLLTPDGQLIDKKVGFSTAMGVRSWVEEKLVK